jgi:hypothetical protein
MLAATGRNLACQTRPLRDLGWRWKTHGPAGCFACSLDGLQVEAEKATRELSGVAAKIAVGLPNEGAD